MYTKVGEKRSIDDINLEDEEAIGSLCRLSGRIVSPKSAMEHEKRIRREIANSNERRRMQSINAGFASLKSLLPHHEGEKLSKAAILQQTTEYIYQLEQEKTRLLAQNSALKRLLNRQDHSDSEGSPMGGESPIDDRTQSTSNSPLSTPLPPSQSTATIATIATGATKEDFEERRGLNRAVKIEERPSYILDDSPHEFDIAPDQIIEYSSNTRASGALKLEIKSENELVAERTALPIERMDITGSHDSIILMKTLQGVEVPRLHGSQPPTVVATTTTTAASGLVASSGSTGLRPLAATGKTAAILTVLPSNKAKSLPQMLELRHFEPQDASGCGEIAATATASNSPAIPAAPSATLEYVDDPTDGSLRNHTFYIVESASSSPCQKNLDTICEAIRHLEGDHLFQTDNSQTNTEQTDEVVTTAETTIEALGSTHVQQQHSSSGLDVQHSRLDVQQHSGMGVQHSGMEVQHSRLDVQHSGMEVQQHTSGLDVQQHCSLEVQHCGMDVQRSLEVVQRSSPFVGRPRSTSIQDHHPYKKDKTMVTSTPQPALIDHRVRSHVTTSLHILQQSSEPQDRPLELTTTHRGGTTGHQTNAGGSARLSQQLPHVAGISNTKQLQHVASISNTKQLPQQLPHVAGGNNKQLPHVAGAPRQTLISSHSRPGVIVVQNH